MLEASEAGDIALMTEMKRILGRKDTSQTVPDCLDGKVTHGDILPKFKECYEELYNSAESEDATALIKVKLENMVNSDTPGSIHEIQKVTGRVVKEACKRMLPGKTDVSEGYTSDVFLHGPDVLFEHLDAVFRSYLLHGTVTLQILTCAPFYHSSREG